MTAQEKQLYLLQLKIKTEVESGIDLLECIRRVPTILCHNPTGALCLHKFKVTGEPRLIAVMEVSDVICLERMVNNLGRCGYIKIVCCLPLVAYEDFARESLKVDATIAKPSTNSIANMKELLWLEATVDYPGRTMVDLLDLWNKEANHVLGARAEGLPIEVFKVASERKVHALTLMSASEFDKNTFLFPIFVGIGSGVVAKCRRVQQLDDYIQRMSA